MENQNARQLSGTQLLRINDVAKLTTLSKSCINLWVAQGRFPKPITLSPTIKVWRAQQLSDWIDVQGGLGTTGESSTKNLEQLHE
jgi:prophage regulatory protein